MRAQLLVQLGAATLIGLAVVADACAAEDLLARRARACTPCHGEQGRAAPDGYQPRIAGKPAGYLYEQLLAFRDGRRRYALMAQLLEPLSDAYLRELAGHFAALDLPYPPPQPAALDAAARSTAQRLVQQGDPTRELPACTACHGRRLTGVQPQLPSLLGLPRDYLTAQLGAWREGTRRSREPDCMAQVARRLGADEVVALAAWLASQPVPAPPQADASLPAPLPLACGSVGAGPR